MANGYHAAAMDEIAERAGVSKPVLYQHFPGKLELYLAILDTHAAALIDAIREGIAATEDNKTRVHNVLSAYFDFIDGEARGDGGVFRLLFESDLANEPAVRERMDRIDRDSTAAVAETVAADTGLSPLEAETAGRGAHRLGPGRGAMVARHRHRRAQGRGGAPDGRPALARDLPLPAAGRPATSVAAPELFDRSAGSGALRVEQLR